MEPTQEKHFDQMTETEKQEFLSKTMEACRKEYQEEPLVTDDLSLTKFLEALKTKGFNFDPFSFIKLLDSEAERQHKSLFGDLFTGLKPDRLAEIKNKVIKWYNEEEVRFETFRVNYIETAKGPAQMELGSTPAFVHPTDVPVEEEAKVLPMKKPVTKTKGKGKR